MLYADECSLKLLVLQALNYCLDSEIDTDLDIESGSIFPHTQ